ncbi:hypothetical protein JTE90_024168 [Oedothorax gibbosus]|uniref:Uncharacterized protein n=1 Tax=Oedothorax gibbosus TaxID=931172 RepID=A0AAV6UCX9_9ARAC|nr:hypothetical protein JTE90_024168 [Oedothorax gibbosus]
MKQLCLVFVCLVLFVQLYGAWSKTCHAMDHCRENECCMTKSSMVGGCRSKGCEGCPCQINNVKSHLGDMYLMSCPCAEDLVCVAEKEIVNPDDSSVEYINSTCQRPDTDQTTGPGLLLQKLPGYLRLQSANGQ